MKDLSIENVKVKINQLKEYICKNSNFSIVRGELDNMPFDEVIDVAISLAYRNGYQSGAMEDYNVLSSSIYDKARGRDSWIRVGRQNDN